jgi:hypothetical protein
VFAQQAPARPPHPVATSVPPAQPADVESIDSILKALYAVISGPPGQVRDWNRMRSLFIPGGRLMPVGGQPKAAVGIRLLTIDDYIATSGAMQMENGFHERELARTVEQFGNIAHVFSTFEAKFEKDNVTKRGINSVQLMHDGQRWWIASLMWQPENADIPLPAKYLPGAAQ